MSTASGLETHQLSSILTDSVDAPTGRVPGVVAGLTDRKGVTFLEAAGKRSLATGVDMTTDSVFAIFSTTKAITGTTALQLVESGDLDLDAPAKEYAPALADTQVLDGFEPDGTPRLRAPKRDITTRHLLLHTAGFGYDFFNENYNRLANEHGQPSVITSSRASIETPLLFDPGEQWEYGTNVDWAGQVVEGITGKRLGEVMQERVFAPLGMRDTGFVLSDDALSRRASIHQRETDGSLTPLDDLILPQDPEVHMGGHGLYSTVGDYLTFQRMWLNDGRGDAGQQILRPETVAWAVKNDLGDLTVKKLTGVIPTLSNDAEFFPGQTKSWSYTFMVNDEQAPTGRPAGAIGWAGLTNLFYWIDRQNGVAGFWATQILPFADGPSFTGYMDFETATYSALH
ncbi:serine hydrolase domain-containing protein [Subtercola endophyticus]|uniref:serine hydrolase domain-containing protein n=1 Tax=Subtercola endophyticus TaxID=2895559 RepID=UPI001E3C19FC|nr:serine hydrolase domain-containing protein [Subtercola endophyticus]UFS60824.1 beta-lactamase family protein [Subtercola endophyticus]